MLLKLEELRKLNITGIFSLGAHYGEEIPLCQELGIKNVVMFEPLKDNFKKLVKNAEGTGFKCIRKALGNINGTVSIHVDMGNNAQSSSVLEPSLHLTQYPHIVFPTKELVDICKLDDYYDEFDGINTIFADLQGYEDRMFKGAAKWLENRIDNIVCEVNIDELYKDCARIEQIDELLSRFDFKRVMTEMTGTTWGDALYIKSRKL